MNALLLVLHMLSCDTSTNTYARARLFLSTGTKCFDLSQSPSSSLFPFVGGVAFAFVFLLIFSCFLF